MRTENRQTYWSTSKFHIFDLEVMEEGPVIPDETVDRSVVNIYKYIYMYMYVYIYISCVVIYFHLSKLSVGQVPRLSNLPNK